MSSNDSSGARTERPEFDRQGDSRRTLQRVGPGDIVVIPPHTAHVFVEISTERIVYTLIRVDSLRLLQLRESTR